ncbi:DUF29 domain-containing protein [Methylobacterium sp. 17Sr1-1]|uniref:DUF29 domain-containing protein n=1 Tax=Methylobacterium sp. 17Sr1-1 TaxID=2202826 RepID=UPI000D703CD3|nr:DUF29 domain-containing protein [Methylobacterium sp. 17Sr1-1]AWN52432.1 DUF29 domain-containing protein [Methylobacterium sp. 17Sr1-1]
MSETDRRALFSMDLSAWAEEQVHLLAAGEVEAIDHAHIAEIVRDLGDRERREIRDRLGVILTGLLPWAAEVDLRCDAWAITIDRQRRLVASRLDDSPSLRPELPWLVAEVYPEAKARAVLESALFDDSFSESCSFTDEEILTPGFLPDPHGDDAIRGAGWWRREATR